MEMREDCQDKIEDPRLRKAIRAFDRAIKLGKPNLAATYLPEIARYGSKELAALTAEALRAPQRFVLSTQRCPNSLLANQCTNAAGHSGLCTFAKVVLTGEALQSHVEG